MKTKSGQIRLLSDHVANKIAAGEVVDRPASVLKELMENAIDAGATQIDVEVVAGGRKSIVVADNGKGMNRDDALLCVERHATSKIQEVDDIETISTLGFRGEALAAIAAVSRFSLTTRPEEEIAGTELTISGGKVQDVKDAGCPVGTTIAVRQVFFNVPARRKFLRTEQTESSHVRQTFLVYAISHPELGLSLTIDGREVYRLSAGAALKDRIRELFGVEVAKGLREVDHQLHDLHLTGFIGLPHLSRNDKSDQFVYINHRPAAAALISYALQEGYQTLVPRGRYPLIFLFIKIDPEKVDVNVHPTKKEVRFRQPIMVRDTVIEAVRDALAQAPIEEVDESGDEPGPVAAPPGREPVVTISDLPVLQPFSYPRMPMAPSETQGRLPVDVAGEAEGEGAPPAPWANARVLGQIGGLYVMLETDDGLVMMDPHAAHERILYERFMAQVLAHEAKSQGLLVPETLELPPKDALVVRTNLKLLKEMGFGIAEFGGDSFVVDAMPTCLGNAAAGAVLIDVAAGLERGGSRGGAERWAEEAIAQAACKAAVKARDQLSVQEVERLVVDLAKATMPYTCPHGRPTVIFMSFQELDKKFGRL